MLVSQSDSTKYPGLDGGQSRDLPAILALYNPQLAPYYARPLQHDRNLLHNTRIEWTNETQALPSADPQFNLD